MVTIILDNINYKGHHFEKVEIELPNIDEIDETNEDRIIPYICEELDMIVSCEELDIIIDE